MLDFFVKIELLALFLIIYKIRNNFEIVLIICKSKYYVE